MMAVALLLIALLLMASSAFAQSDGQNTRRFIDTLDQQWQRKQKARKGVRPPSDLWNLPPRDYAPSPVPPVAKDLTGERFVAALAWGCGTVDDLLMTRKAENSLQARAAGISGPDFLPENAARDLLDRKQPGCTLFMIGQRVTASAIEGLPEYIRLRIPGNKRPYLVDATIPLTIAENTKPRLIKVSDSAVKVLRVNIDEAPGTRSSRTGECIDSIASVRPLPDEWCDWIHLRVYGYNTTNSFLHYDMACEAYDRFGRLLGKSETKGLGSDDPWSTRWPVGNIPPFFINLTWHFIKADRAAAARIDCHAVDVNAMVSPDSGG